MVLEKFRNDNNKVIYSYYFLFPTLLLFASFCAGNLDLLLEGLIEIITCPTRLVVDPVAIGGLGSCLLNSALVGYIACGVMFFSGVKVAPVTMGTYYLTVGLSFYGITITNMLPVLLGTYLYSKIRKEHFSKNSCPALLACSIAPFVSEMFFSEILPYNFLTRIVLGFASGMIIGFFYPPTLAHSAKVHKGFNLFNAGLASGFLGIILFGIYKSTILLPLNIEHNDITVYSDSNPSFFIPMLLIFYTITLIIGLVLNKGFRNYMHTNKLEGYKNNFLSDYGAGITLINLAMLGYLMTVYLIVVDAPFTGPSIGASFCVLCWSANGTHIRNVLPIMLGYYLASLVCTWELGTQGIVLGLMFATGLSPIAGRYGIVWGSLAGALHALIAPFIAAFHGGFNVYNGGFGAGLIALFLVPVIEVITLKHKEKVKEHMN